MKNNDFWKKIGITIGALLFVKVIAHVPVPGVKADLYQMAVTQYTNPSFSLMNQLSGGALSNMTILGLGISPYISASIIVQLLCAASEYLGNLSREGYYGQKKIEKLNILFGIASSVMIALIASFGLLRLGYLQKPSVFSTLLVAASLCLGAVFLIGIGKLIDKKGIGNGISLILFINIASTLPQDVRSVIEAKENGAVLLIVITTIILGIVLFMELSKKEIRILGSRSLQVSQDKELSHIPIKVAICGVMPILFVSTFQQIGGFFKMLHLDQGVLNFICKLFSSESWFMSKSPYSTGGIVLYLAMLTGFAFLYANLIFNPVNVAGILKGRGNLIPNVRPGNDTVRFLRKERRSMVFFDVLLLAIISLTPIFLANVYSLPMLRLSGTTIIIAVSVVIETKRCVWAEFLGMRYDTKKWFD